MVYDNIKLLRYWSCEYCAQQFDYSKKRLALEHESTCKKPKLTFAEMSEALKR